MDAEYKISTIAPDSINLYAHGNAPLEPFAETFGGTLTEDSLGNPYVSFSFTADNAERLRTFFTGKPLEVSEKDRTILGYLVRNPESVFDDTIHWSVDLTDLHDFDGLSRSRKLKNGWDIMHYLPLRYVDKSNPQLVSELQLGEWSVVAGTIANDVVYDAYRKLTKIIVQDAAGGTISGTLFRMPWLTKTFRRGDSVVIYGNYDIYTYKNKSRVAQLTNAKLERLNSALGSTSIVPIYPQNSTTKTMKVLLKQQETLLSIVWINDPVPVELLEKYGLMSRNQAYRQVHFPNSMAEMEKARRRLAFDDYLRLQVFLDRRRENKKDTPSVPKLKYNWADQYVKSLPFNLTVDQKSVLTEMREDLKKIEPMYRLLQGDVGSGKTETASIAILQAIESGHQAALLAPTDILSEQTYKRLTNDFERAGLSDKIRVGLLNSAVTPKKQKEIKEALTAGDIDLLIGTVSIIQDSVIFKNLGFGIIDEQHKFGIEQRTALTKKAPEGLSIDLLSMTATPIPRTTSQILYGDMDISIMKTPPEGRLPIITEWHTNPTDAYKHVDQELNNGHQAYVVTALVEETENSERLQLDDALQTHAELVKRFPNHKIGMLHGQLPKKEKAAILEAYKNHEIDVLVATTVVEVGINVPNATVMVILNANRHGMAGLHQIRGRVGRSNLQSYCYLIGEATTSDAEARLTAITQSTDGFYLAEKDLFIRGEGDLFSFVQSGDNSMNVANLRDNKDLLDITKAVLPQAKKSAKVQYEVALLYKDKEVNT